MPINCIATLQKGSRIAKKVIRIAKKVIRIAKKVIMDGGNQGQDLADPI